MSYGGQSNAPWQRNVMQGHPQSGGFHQGTQMFMQNAQQNNMAAFGHGGMQGGGNMFPGGGAGGGGNSVSYPQPRSGLNPVAFQQGGGNQSHYNSIGTVTKMNNDCGLVNDEVFFYRNVCKGPEPKLGDRVIFEATYSNNGQFKWNATRVQLMQQPQPLMGSNKGSYSSVAPPNDYQRGQMRHNSPKRSPVRGRHDRDHRDRERLHRSRDRDEVCNYFLQTCLILCFIKNFYYFIYRMNMNANVDVKIMLVAVIVVQYPIIVVEPLLMIVVVLTPLAMKRNVIVLNLERKNVILQIVNEKNVKGKEKRNVLVS